MRYCHGIDDMNWFTWSLLSALFAGITAVLAKAGVSEVNSHLATAVRTSVVLFFTWGIAFAASKPAEVFQFSKRTWLFLTLSGIATGLSWICYFRALQVGDVAKVAPIDKLSVVFAIIFAAIFLREKLSWQHAIGGSLIVAGALVLAWKK